MRCIAIVLSGGVVLTAGSGLEGQIFVPNNANDSVTVYERDADGEVMPIRTIAGAATDINFPFALAVDPTHEELFVSNFSDFVEPETITVYDLSADGDIAPKRTLVGEATQLDSPIGIDVDAVNDELFVRNFSGSTIHVYSRTASGDTPPLRTLAGNATEIDVNTVDLSVDAVNDELVVASRSNGNPDAILVFARTASGNTAPIRRITGDLTTLDDPYGVHVDPSHDEILVAGAGGVQVFSRTASGNVAPLRTISGPLTGLEGAANGVDLVDNEIFVSRRFPDTVLVFARTASGNVEPLRTIAGAQTELDTPGLLAVVGPLFSDGFESGDTSVWTAATP